MISSLRRFSFIVIMHSLLSTRCLCHLFFFAHSTTCDGMDAAEKGGRMSAMKQMQAKKSEMNAEDCLKLNVVQRNEKCSQYCTLECLSHVTERCWLSYMAKKRSKKITQTSRQHFPCFDCRQTHFSCSMVMICDISIFFLFNFFFAAACCRYWCFVIKFFFILRWNFLSQPDLRCWCW